MAKNAIVCVALALAVGGCAGMSRSARTADSPSASVADVSSIAGHWQGSIYETGGSLVSGSTPVDLTIAPDGTWRGTLGKSVAEGRARLRGSRVVLQGTAAAPDGPARPVYLDLRNNGQDLWGQTVATFSGHQDRGAVALGRTQS
jgi:hypothetical protein